MPGHLVKRLSRPLTNIFMIADLLGSEGRGGHAAGDVVLHGPMEMMRLAELQPRPAPAAGILAVSRGDRLRVRLGGKDPHAGDRQGGLTAVDDVVRAGFDAPAQGIEIWQGSGIAALCASREQDPLPALYQKTLERNRIIHFLYRILQESGIKYRKAVC